MITVQTVVRASAFNRTCNDCRGPANLLCGDMDHRDVISLKKIHAEVDSVALILRDAEIAFCDIKRGMVEDIH